jgi:hypothetical protein
LCPLPLPHVAEHKLINVFESFSIVWIKRLNLYWVSLIFLNFQFSLKFSKAPLCPLPLPHVAEHKLINVFESFSIVWIKRLNLYWLSLIFLDFQFSLKISKAPLCPRPLPHVAEHKLINVFESFSIVWIKRLNLYWLSLIFLDFQFSLKISKAPLCPLPLPHVAEHKLINVFESFSIVWIKLTETMLTFLIFLDFQFSLKFSKAPLCPLPLPHVAEQRLINVFESFSIVWIKLTETMLTFLIFLDFQFSLKFSKAP